MEKSQLSIANILYCMNKYGVVIYGAGKRGQRALETLSEYGYSVKYVVDKEKGKMIGDFSSVAFSEINKMDDAVCVITPLVSSEEYEAIKKETGYYFRISVSMRIVELLKYFIPNNDEVMNFFSARPFNHYESPYTNREEYEFCKNMKCTHPNRINMNIDKQLSFIPIIGNYSCEYHKKYHKEAFRYRHNGMFEDGDGMVYHSMIRHFKPKRIIEIGSGYSTAVALDTIDFWEMDATDITCIEPYPDRLYSILKQTDNERVTVIRDLLQNVKLDEFEALEENDILFIDSSHVVKNGGDVTREYLEILPRLKEGVIIHIHDIFYPFCYPLQWISNGVPYNEAYLLHAFLMDNANYEILFWEDYIGRYYKDEYEYYRGEIPDIGSSFWMKKIHSPST